MAWYVVLPEDQEGRAIRLRHRRMWHHVTRIGMTIAGTRIYFWGDNDYGNPTARTYPDLKATRNVGNVEA